jgi:hypothetical protein
MRPSWLTRSWSGSGAAWRITDWGSWKRPVSLLAMHHWSSRHAEAKPFWSSGAPPQPVAMVFSRSQLRSLLLRSALSPHSARVFGLLLKGDPLR